MRFILKISLIMIVILMQMGCEPISNEKQMISEGWTMAYDPDNLGLLEGAFNRDYDRSNWIPAQVPGDWSDGEYDGFAWSILSFRQKTILLVASSPWFSNLLTTMP